MRKHFLIFLLLTSGTFFYTDSVAQHKTKFIEPEFLVGKIVANYESFPDAKTRSTFQLNIGSYLNNPEIHENRYYNLPHVGVSLGYSNLGNKHELGEELSVVPYILLNASKHQRSSWSFKFGLGASYFTKPFVQETNIFNKAIGSKLNWTFQAFLYHSLLVTERLNVKLGAGYWHSSNAHTQLPNFGLNTAMASISCSYYMQNIDPEFKIEPIPKSERKISRFIQVRTGLGMHEFGSTIGPVGGPKKPVYTLSGDYGLLLNHQLKLYSGLFFRYYQSFNDYLKESETDSDESHFWQSSNVNFHIGAEYLIGHVGMNIEGGLNLYKPFYDDFYELFENGDSFNQFRMSMFNSRLGLNLYLKNTRKSPDSNVALGAHINANFGKADFAEVNLTYMKKL